MKLSLLGLGQAGGKIVDEFLSYESRTRSDFIVSAHAINTARADLAGLEAIPRENRILIGQSRVKGHGVGADNELAAEIAADDIGEIDAALDEVPGHEIDAFLVVAALGGGTGSGAGPVVAKHLRRLYTEPVYGLGVLPARNEGGIYTLNAARSLQTYVRETDNLLLFDNDAWRTAGESMQEGYDIINEELVRRFGVLFSAGEGYREGDVAESVVDSSEIINTLSCGGVSTVGYAAADVEQRSGLFSRFGIGDGDGLDDGSAVNRITTLIRQATLGRLTLPCEPEGTERALVVLSGPPDHLSRKGIERGRTWLETETESMEVRGGDYPLPTEDRIAAVVLLSGVTDVPRVESLKRTAVDTQDAIDEAETRRESAMDEFLADDQLDTLF